MRLAVETVSSIPRMAWAAGLPTGGRKLVVRAGSGISVSEDELRFAEGLVLRPSDAMAEASHHFGLSSGGGVAPGRAIFWTPGHILDRLFVVQNAKGSFVSNSLPFALRASGARLLADRLHYPWDLGHITAHEQYVPIEGGRLRVISNAVIEITSQGEVHVSRKDPAPSFDDYKSYVHQLEKYLDEVAAANRVRTGGALTPVTTISSGYDSPAASVLSLRLGTAKALTILDSRGGTTGDDSGEQIAAILGLTVKTASRSDYKAYGWEAERLFYVFGLPEDILLYPFADDLENALLFTGLQGDRMWDTKLNPAGGEWSWDPGGASLQEFRLRTGFVHLPPAFFGWRHYERLVGISNSAEMAPWTLGTDYDRPIPRRIVEERGVPRDAFGMEKKAVTATFGIDNDRYIKPEELGLSADLLGRLQSYGDQVSGYALGVEMFVSNLAHGAIRRAHHSARDMKKSSPRNGRGVRQRATHLVQAIDTAIPIRRKYMQPFSVLNFSAQIANADLANDYVDL